MPLQKLVDLNQDLVDRAARTFSEDGGLGHVPTRLVFARAVENWLTVVVALIKSAGLLNTQRSRRRPRKFEERTWRVLQYAEREVDVAQIALLRSALELQAQYGSDVRGFLKTLPRTVKDLECEVRAKLTAEPTTET